MNLRATIESKIMYVILTYTKELIQTPESESVFEIIKKHHLTFEDFEDLKFQLIMKAVQNQISAGYPQLDFLNLVKYRPKEYKTFPQQANEFYALCVSVTNMNYAPFSDFEKMILKLKEYNLVNWWMINGQSIFSFNSEVNSIMEFGNDFVERYQAFYNKLIGGVGKDEVDNSETHELIKKQNAYLTGVSYDVKIPSKKLTKALKGGWCGPDLIVIGARPSMGKTSFALGLMIPASYTDDIMFWSLEVTKVQIMNKVASHLTGIEYNDIKHGKLNSAQLQNSLAAFDYIKKNMKLHIYDNKKIPFLEQFKAEAIKKHKLGKLKMIVIDYLQMIKSTEKKSTREQEVAHISRELKLLANELNVPIIALAQLKRKDRQGGIVPRPNLEDLRESGAIEQDADIVAFLHRDAYYQDKNLNIPYEQEFITEWIQAKGRDVGTAHVKIFNDVKKFVLHDNF